MKQRQKFNNTIALTDTSTNINRKLKQKMNKATLLVNTARTYTLGEIAEKMNQYRQFIIMSHYSADGDALGSCFALSRVLSLAGKKTVIYLEEEIPDTYMFLTGTERYFVYKADNKDNADYNTHEAGFPKEDKFPQEAGFPKEDKFPQEDLCVIVLDTADSARLGKRLQLMSIGSVSINIDHHLTNNNFSDFNYIETKAAATGEIIYDLTGIFALLQPPDIKNKIFDDEKTATCLFTAIASDTGGFRFSNVTPDVMRKIADIMERGAKSHEILRMIFDITTMEKIKLTGLAVNSLKLYENGRIAVITFNKQQVLDHGSVDDDFEGLVNIARNLKGVEIAIMARHRPDDKIRVSLRSNVYVDVSKLAGAFGGGGHLRAAGCTLQPPVEAAVKRLVEAAEELLKETSHNPEILKD